MVNRVADVRKHVTESGLLCVPLWAVPPSFVKNVLFLLGETFHFGVEDYWLMRLPLLIRTRMHIPECSNILLQT